MFFDAGHLAEGAVVTIGHEHGIVAETGGTARWPDQGAVGARLDFLDVTVGPGDAERGDEMCTALVGRPCAALLQQAFDPGHRRVKILVWSSPARRKYPGRATEAIDHQS